MSTFVSPTSTLPATVQDIRSMRRLIIVLLLFALAPPVISGGKEKAKPRFSIGKDTTYITSPRDENGYIDYATALNELSRKGVTAATNANTLLVQAFGPRHDGREVAAKFFEWMNIEVPAAHGPYFVDLFRFLRERFKIDTIKHADEIWAEYDRARARPWQAKDYPRISAWLEANAKPLALVVEASKRPHYFSPFVCDGSKPSSGLIGALFHWPGPRLCRECSLTLNVRAMLCLGEARYVDAWQDLLACHRLGRLLTRGATLTDVLVGMSIDGIAREAGIAFLHFAKLDAKKIKACQRDLQSLPSMAPFVETVRVADRFVLLDMILMTERHGMSCVETSLKLFDAFTERGTREEVKIPVAAAQRFLANMDWDHVLRNTNRWYDRVANALATKDRVERDKQLARLQTELDEIETKLRKTGRPVLKSLLGAEKPAQASQMLSDVLLTSFLQSTLKVERAGKRSEQIYRNHTVAFALAAYQRDHGRYPLKLENLAPAYLSAIPGDLFSRQALFYRPSEKGFLLYSVGENGRDEGGRAYDDDPPGDDPRVRLPLPEWKRR